MAHTRFDCVPSTWIHIEVIVSSVIIVSINNSQQLHCWTTKKQPVANLVIITAKNINCLPIVDKNNIYWFQMK